MAGRIQIIGRYLSREVVFCYVLLLKSKRKLDFLRCFLVGHSVRSGSLFVRILDHKYIVYGTLWHFIINELERGKQGKSPVLETNSFKIHLNYSSAKVLNFLKLKFTWCDTHNQNSINYQSFLIGKRYLKESCPNWRAGWSQTKKYITAYIELCWEIVCIIFVFTSHTHTPCRS